jgi:hypothetical protein
MRRDPMRRAWAAACAAALVLGTVGVAAGPAAAKVTKPNAAARELAAEVCEEMVSDAAVGIAGEELLAPQQGTWTGWRFSCPYRFADGTLLVTVDVFRSVASAKRGFEKVRDRETDPTRLFGIGKQAFQAEDFTLVSRKDNFVLTVDPTALPDRIDRDAMAFATTRAVFDCW